MYAPGQSNHHSLLTDILWEKERGGGGGGGCEWQYITYVVLCTCTCTKCIYEGWI